MEYDNNNDNDIDSVYDDGVPSIITRTDRQQIIFTWSGRIGALISFFSAMYIVIMVLRCPRKRNRIYHRIMMGMSINIMIAQIGNIWGVSSVPVGTISGAAGNITTCSIRGFWAQMQFAVPIYYDGLALYSLIAMHYNFRIAKYACIEKYIHIGVYIFPLFSSIYILSVDAFNFNGSECWTSSVPFGCGDHNGIICTRGPQNISQLQWLSAGLPIMFIMLSPTILMIGAYFNYRRKLWIETKKRAIQKKEEEEEEEGVGGGDETTTTTIIEKQQQQEKNGQGGGATVAKQMGLYLLALYWTYGFTFINTGILFGLGREIFPMYLLAHIVWHLIGLWILIVYLYFNQLQRQISAINAGRSSGNNNNNTNNTNQKKLARNSSKTIRESTFLSTCIIDEVSGNNNSDNGSNKSLKMDDINNDNAVNSASDFQIFDGSNPSDAWKDFIFDGEDEDYYEDEAEADKWRDVIQS